MYKVKSSVIKTENTTFYSFGGNYIKALLHPNRKPCRVVLQAITKDGYLIAEGFLPKVRGLSTCLEWMKKNTVKID